MFAWDRQGSGSNQCPDVRGGIEGSESLGVGFSTNSTDDGQREGVESVYCRAAVEL